MRGEGAGETNLVQDLVSIPTQQQGSHLFRADPVAETAHDTVGATLSSTVSVPPAILSGPTEPAFDTALGS